MRLGLGRDKGTSNNADHKGRRYGLHPL